MLMAGDIVLAQGLVIGVEYRFAKTKVTFKGSRERVYPNDELVTLLMSVPPPEATAPSVL
jgi:hypothetical protein